MLKALIQIDTTDTPAVQGDLIYEQLMALAETLVDEYALVMEDIERWFADAVEAARSAEASAEADAQEWVDQIRENAAKREP